MKITKIISTTHIKYSFQKQRKWSLLVTSNESKTSNHVSTKSEIIRATNSIYWNRFGEETKRPSNIETRCQHNCQIVDIVI